MLVAGGTGRLGRHIVCLLTARGMRVRILTRHPTCGAPLRSGPVEHSLVERVPGDVSDLEAVTRAMDGITTVISALHGFAGTGHDTPGTVDHQGNVSLIEAARAGGVEHFVLMSVQGAAPDHPIELFRMKFLAEQALQGSGLPWTIIRATAFMETWTQLIGEPLLKRGSTMIFGRGHNPINFVSVYDVAAFVALAVTDDALRGQLLEVGGPENLSLRQLVDRFEHITHTTGVRRAVPLPMMRVMSQLMRRVNPRLARQIAAGVVMDTRDMSFDASDRHQRYPLIPMTTLADTLVRDYGAASQ